MTGRSVAIGEILSAVIRVASPKIKNKPPKPIRWYLPIASFVTRAKRAKTGTANKASVKIVIAFIVNPPYFI
ncbi:hypothetical protein LBK6_04110 [Leptospira borgpetersenii serovar Hardjo]|nr:hypothetical protein LBK6_04110 [Leptospira borgpetersenii serovar Hardjo]AMX60807.1 hypothetical protein LBK9_04055 [Leptospira borgpetersenii serovar Hardjo]AMX64052.1 hypothetical protein LBK30_04100 [Leptospira borgpetersenii serovar Hardjo]AMX67292.1 hypothetical protein LBHA_04070 [Leptospira borgpetersenii serovar Hardjo]AMX72028.1 hypothetical protein LBHB_12460 [Leptospira borgpetersenii serovar Hardjo]